MATCTAGKATRTRRVRIDAPLGSSAVNTDNLRKERFEMETGINGNKPCSLQIKSAETQDQPGARQLPNVEERTVSTGSGRRHEGSEVDAKAQLDDHPPTIGNHHDETLRAAAWKLPSPSAVSSDRPTD